MDSIAFGPWIGELGWELTSWQGWVRYACKTKYKSHRKYILTFPGRECLYQGIDATFLSHPKWFRNVQYSARAYATDYWTKNGPKIKNVTYNGPYMKTTAKKLLHHYMEKLSLPKENFMIPWRVFSIDDKQYGGVTSSSPRRRWVPKKIVDRFQDVSPITSIASHTQTLHGEMKRQGFDPNSKLLLLFPRGRQRHGDKNWPEKYYIKLHRTAKKILSEYVVSFVGSPDGALFPKGAPAGVLDLIHIQDPNNRLNIHVAAMKQSVIGVGPASGILHVAAYCKLPFICNVDHKTNKKYPNRFTHDLNPFGCNCRMLVGDCTLDTLRQNMRDFTDEVVASRSIP